jgi:hypothetical protein
VKISVHEAPLHLTPGSLNDWLHRSTLLDGAVHRSEDTPVFISRDTLLQAREWCRLPGSLEGGALLVGRLFEQTSPEHEIFLLVEGAIEARHSQQEQFSLTLTPETFKHLQRRLELRRKRLKRPGEILLGTAHGHNFGPSVDEKGAARCPACDRRASCLLHTATMSGEDHLYHKALFARQPFAIGLVWGLDARSNDVLKAFGFRDGTFQERSVWIVDARKGDIPP